MSSHSVAGAKNHRPKLIDRALKGEHVVIPRQHANKLLSRLRDEDWQ